MPTVSASELRNRLHRVDWPADKDTLFTQAVEQGAGEDVQKAIRSLPPVEYANVDEVVRSVTVDVE